MFLSGIKMGVNIVCTLLLPGKHPWSISYVAICKINSCLAPCAISVTLPFLSRGARSVTSLTLYDVSKLRLTLLGAFWLPRRNILVL